MDISTSKVVETDTIYQYSKVTEQDGIRLILLQPSHDLDARIKCSLIHTTLTECDNDILEHYVALSYVWGDQADKCSILVDGRALEVTASLDCALRHLRDHHRVLRIWADGICINQNDVKDRNYQVSQMGSVYTVARHCIIFLGPAFPDCDSVMRMFSSGSSKYSHRLRMRDPKAIVPALDDDFEAAVEEHIFSKPWFTRIWVLQELALSPDPWVQIGKTRLRWDEFCKPILSGEWQGGFWHHLEAMNEARSRLRVTASPQDMVDGQHATKQEQALIDIMVSRRGLGVSDPRDMVYGHLGMVDIRSQVIDINYEKTTGEVYTDVARMALQIVPLHIWLDFVENVESSGNRGDIPSWVPDWTRPCALRNHEQTQYIGLSTEIGSPVVPNILAVLGYSHGKVKAIIPLAWFPPSARVLDSSDNAPGIRWLRASENQPNVRRMVHTILEYHESMSPEFMSRLRMCPRVYDSFPYGGYHFNLSRYMKPYIFEWYPYSNSLEETDGVHSNATTKFVDNVTALLITNIRFIARFFEVPDMDFRIAAVALLDTGLAMRIPTRTQVGDMISVFKGEHYRINTTCILRPFDGDTPEVYDTAIANDFIQRGKCQGNDSLQVEHFTYVNLGLQVSMAIPDRLKGKRLALVHPVSAEYALYTTLTQTIRIFALH